jgi:hypothetical protein
MYFTNINKSGPVPTCPEKFFARFCVFFGKYVQKIISEKYFEYTNKYIRWYSIQAGLSFSALKIQIVFKNHFIFIILSLMFRIVKTTLLIILDERF